MVQLGEIGCNVLKPLPDQRVIAAKLANAAQTVARLVAIAVEVRPLAPGQNAAPVLAQRLHDGDVLGDLGAIQEDQDVAVVALEQAVLKLPDKAQQHPFKTLANLDYKRFPMAFSLVVGDVRFSLVKVVVLDATKFHTQPPNAVVF